VPLSVVLLALLREAIPGSQNNLSNFTRDEVAMLHIWMVSSVLESQTNPDMVELTEVWKGEGKDYVIFGSPN
jgi:hypothetical protein